MSEDGFELEALPPERRRSRSIIVASGSCCCCCCCCLHTIGGFVGAVIPGKNPPGVNTDLADRLYWLSVVTVVVLAFLFVLGQGKTGTVNGLYGIGLGLALVFPLVQLVASILSAGMLLVSPAQHKGACLRRLGQMTFRSVAFALLGAAPFILLWLVVQ